MLTKITFINFTSGKTTEVECNVNCAQDIITWYEGFHSGDHIEWESSEDIIWE